MNRLIQAFQESQDAAALQEALGELRPLAEAQGMEIEESWDWVNKNKDKLKAGAAAVGSVVVAGLAKRAADKDKKAKEKDSAWANARVGEMNKAQEKADKLNSGDFAAHAEKGRQERVAQKNNDDFEKHAAAGAAARKAKKKESTDANSYTDTALLQEASGVLRIKALQSGNPSALLDIPTPTYDSQTGKWSLLIQEANKRFTHSSRSECIASAERYIAAEMRIAEASGKKLPPWLAKKVDKDEDTGNDDGEKAGDEKDDSEPDDDEDDDEKEEGFKSRKAESAPQRQALPSTCLSLAVSTPGVVRESVSNAIAGWTGNAPNPVPAHHAQHALPDAPFPRYGVPSEALHSENPAIRAAAVQATAIRRQHALQGLR